jgi:hypothetical protein
MQNVGGMILTGENRNNRRKGSPNTTLSISNFKWTGLASNPNLRVEIPATNLLRHGPIARRLRKMLTCRSAANSRPQPLEWLVIKVWCCRWTHRILIEENGKEYEL